MQKTLRAGARRPRSMSGWRRLFAGAAISGLGLATLCFQSGCHRAQYREQADHDSYCALQEKGDDPRWATPEINVDGDPHSRFAHPYDPDHPPMPPDDETAHGFMHCADGHRGSKHWHDYGGVDQVESPNWREYLDLGADGSLTLNQQKSVELAIRHSSQYQAQIESLYLSALDLTFQRFRFDTWYFAGTGTNYRHFGSGSINNPATGKIDGNETNTLTTRNTAQATGAGGRGSQSGGGLGKLYPTGATLLVDFANSFVWTFTGNNTAHSASSLNMTLVQPLLRNAGRKVVLEALTKSERSVLYATRDFERYRENFYVSITTGSDRGVSVSRASGLSAGLGDLGFGNVFGTQALGGAGGGAGGAGAAVGQQTAVSGGTGAGQVGGYLGLVQQRINIRNLEHNVASTAASLAQLESLFAFGRGDLIQVDQARQRLQTARSNLLQQEAAFEAQLDQYKRTLGLPPDLIVTIDESEFDFLQLMDPEVVQLQNQTDEVLTAVRELPPAAVAADLAIVASRGKQIIAPAQSEFESATRDFAKLHANLDTRIARIAAAADRNAYLEDVSKLDSAFSVLQERFRATIEELNRWTPEGPNARKKLQDKLTEVSGELLELSLAQTRARAEIVPVPNLEFTEEESVRTARDNDLELMNAKARLVDAWRNIEFQADRLKGDLNLTFNADVETLPIGMNNNPVRFRSANSSYSVGFRFDAPLTKLEERNIYREALIDYHQQRRAYIQTEDRIVQQLRAELRNAAVNRNNFELRRNALLIALRQVDQTVEKLNEPARVGQPAISSNATRDLIEAQTNLLNNQNDFISVWFSNETIRRSLARDLGVLRVDERGLWRDGDKDLRSLLPRETPADRGVERQIVPPPEPLPYRGGAAFESDSPEAGAVQQVGGTRPLAPAATLRPPSAIDDPTEPPAWVWQ